MNIPQLRPDYQEPLKNKTFEAIQSGHKSILNVLATGGGKTIIFADITRDFTKRRKRTWILTHREEIRLQTVEKLFSFGLQPGQIAAGQPITGNLVQVASIQTLVNRLEELKYVGLTPDLIQIDECHHAIAPTWLKIIDAFPQAINLGWTATPTRMDDTGLGNIYTHMNEGPQSAWLVDRGYLTEPLVFSSRAAIDSLKQKYKIKNNELDLAAQTKFLGQKYVVNETLQMYAQYFNGAPAIIFCASVKDCDKVSKAMNAVGWKTGVVKSGMDSDLRKDYISGLGTGKYNAICSYEVIGEGVDIPVLAGIIMRRLTKSIVVYLQQTGRALRSYPGKKHAIIIDQAGNYYLHGHPLNKRHWSLDGKSLKTSEEEEIKSITCPNSLCMAFITLDRVIDGLCPYCGSELNDKSNTPKKKELKIVNAELLKVDCPVYVPELNEKKEKSESTLVDNIIKQTLDDYEKRENNIEKRFDFLMNELDNSKIKKVWGQYGKF
jgi:superfamily II DNA or RNA helicase